MKAVCLALLSLFSMAAKACDPPPRHYDRIAFCGYSPYDPNAVAGTRALAAAGIDATMGPCLPPPDNYTAANTGSRYMTPDQYGQLTLINAWAGMRTVVYDARLWSDDPATRQAALDYWMPVIDHVYAWDMGDEFGDTEFAVLAHRWQNIQTYVEPVTGVAPFTNTLPFTADLDRQLTLGPDVSFDKYDGDHGAALAEHYAPLTDTLTCAVNAMDLTGIGLWAATHDTIVWDMAILRNAKCDRYLIFGGHVPYGTTDFGTSSIVDANGNPTALASAVRDGAS